MPNNTTLKSIVMFSQESYYNTMITNGNVTLPDGTVVVYDPEHYVYCVPYKIPEAPTTDGTYTLKVTVSNGVATYQWVAE